MGGTYTQKWIDILRCKLGQAGSVNCPIGVVAHQLDVRLRSFHYGMVLLCLVHCAETETKVKMSLVMPISMLFSALTLLGLIGDN